MRSFLFYQVKVTVYYTSKTIMNLVIDGKQYRYCWMYFLIHRFQDFLRYVHSNIRLNIMIHVVKEIRIKNINKSWRWIIPTAKWHQQNKLSKIDSSIDQDHYIMIMTDRRKWLSIGMYPLFSTRSIISSTYYRYH